MSRLLLLFAFLGLSGCVVAPACDNGYCGGSYYGSGNYEIPYRCHDYDGTYCGDRSYYQPYDEY
jgi:hypothetical protein